MNFERYPWLHDLSSREAQDAIQEARDSYETTGAVVFHEFITAETLQNCCQDARAQEDTAFTTDDTHTAYQLDYDPMYPKNSVRNHFMRTKVASIAMDELPQDSDLIALYRHPTLRQLVAAIVKKHPTDAAEDHHDADADDAVANGNEDKSNVLYLSEDPLGACSINVFRPNYYHAFHFDESEFSTTLMLQQGGDKNDTSSGLFQYTHPLRSSKNDLVMPQVASILRTYDDSHTYHHDTDQEEEDTTITKPILYHHHRRRRRRRRRLRHIHFWKTK